MRSTHSDRPAVASLDGNAVMKNDYVSKLPAVAVCMCGAARTLHLTASPLVTFVLQPLAAQHEAVELLAVLAVEDQTDLQTQALLRGLRPVAEAYIDGAADYVSNGSTANVRQFARFATCWRLLLEREARRTSCYGWALRIRPDLIWQSSLPPLSSLPPHAVAARALSIRSKDMDLASVPWPAWSINDIVDKVRRGRRFLPSPKQACIKTARCVCLNASCLMPSASGGVIDYEEENLPDDQFAVVPRALCAAYFGTFGGPHAPCDRAENSRTHTQEGEGRCGVGIGDGSGSGSGSALLRPICKPHVMFPERCLCTVLASAGVQFAPTAFSVFKASRAYSRQQEANQPNHTQNQNLASVAPTGERALCIDVVLTGFARAYEGGLASIRERIVVPNQRLHHQVRLFVHTWDIKGNRIRTDTSGDMPAADVRFDEREPRRLRWKNTTISQEPVDQGALRAALSAVGADSVKLSVESYAHVATIWNATMPERRWKPGSSKSRHQVLTKMGMFYGIHRAFSMLKETSIVPDAVIRTRFDVMYLSEVLIRWHHNDSSLQLVLIAKASATTVAGVSLATRLSLDPCLASGSANSSLVQVVEQQLERLQLNPRVVEQADLAQGTTSSRPQEATCAPVIALPARSNIADDMFAIGTFGAMERYCSAFTRLQPIIDHLWPMREPLQGEDVVIVNLAWSAARARIMGDMESILEKAAGSVAG